VKIHLLGQSLLQAKGGDEALVLLQPSTRDYSNELQELLAAFLDDHADQLAEKDWTAPQLLRVAERAARNPVRQRSLLRAFLEKSRDADSFLAFATYPVPLKSKEAETWPEFIQSRVDDFLALHPSRRQVQDLASRFPELFLLENPEVANYLRYQVPSALDRCRSLFHALMP
jgi:hypothetical protein